MGAFLKSRSEGSTVECGAPFLIYSPRHPRQHLERGQQKRLKDSLSPQSPETKFSGSHLISSERSRGMSTRGQSSQAGPLPSCGHHSPEAGCASPSLSQSSADASQPRAALPGAVTPPARLALSLSGPGVAAGAEDGLSRRLAPRGSGSTFRKVRTKEHQSLVSGACHQGSLVLGLLSKLAVVWPWLFKDQASLRQVPSAVTPATSSPAADSRGLPSAIWWPNRAAPQPPDRVPPALATLQPRGLEMPVLKSHPCPPDSAQSCRLPL